MLKRVRSYVQSIFDVKMPENKILQELYVEITNSLTSAYKLPATKSYLQHQKVKALLDKSIEYYVGSRVCPRNQSITSLLLSQAKINAEKTQNPEIMDLVEYHYAYFAKMDAMKSANKIQYQSSSDKFLELSERGNPLASYLTGKQLYLLVEGGHLEKSLIHNCLTFFQKSICDQQYGGLYYIAELENKYFKNLNEEEIFELICWATSLGHPLAHFKMALMYENEQLRYKERQEYGLYKQYILEAAEMGVLEAQHNLAFDYLKGEVFPKNQVKAFAWFTNASAHGFIYSKYNAAKILQKGTECKTIKPNKKAALVLLEEINRSGELDVEDELKALVDEVDEEKQ